MEESVTVAIKEFLMELCTSPNTFVVILNTQCLVYRISLALRHLDIKFKFLVCSTISKDVAELVVFSEKTSYI